MGRIPAGPGACGATAQGLADGTADRVSHSDAGCPVRLLWNGKGAA